MQAGTREGENERSRSMEEEKWGGGVLKSYKRKSKQLLTEGKMDN